jgi:hypothetical protein
MDRTLIVCASHKGLELQTQACVTALQKHGARLLSVTGVADVALARNQVFTAALQAIARGNLPTDVLLLVDDDMVFDLNAATKLVSLARETGEAWSAAYATKDANLAATPLNWDAGRTDGLRMVGLGLCAVPLKKFTELATQLGAVVGPNGHGVIPFCQCRVVTPEHDGAPRWCSEDYWFCLAIGGVRLAPHVAAGHLKTVPLWPDPETLRRLAEGIPLNDPDPEQKPPDAPPAPPAPETPAAKKSRNRSNKKKRKGNANGATQNPA